MSESSLLVLAKEFKKLRDDTRAILTMPVGPQGECGEKGEQGPKGEPGRDGAKGLPGRDGRDGRDGTDGRNGRDGKDGADGKDGEDGVSVVNAEIDFDGHLVVTLSDGREIDAGDLSTENRPGGVFVSGGNGQPNTGTATLDFGAFPGSNEASVSVTGQATIRSASIVNAFVSAGDTSGTHTASDHRYFPVFASLTCGIPTDGVGFTIYARSSEKMMGTFAVRWVWSN